MDVRRVDQAPDRRVDDPGAEHEQRDPVHLGGEDLGAAEAERPRPARRSGRETRGDERDRERGRVGEHVPRVGEQGERAGDDPRGDLGRHQAEDQRERDRDRPAVFTRLWPCD